ncbi:MAG: FprA family A-type flavoprotein [Acidobacteria bacterium]|nr:FprA family A-type flavoprotein [Acidobacteriota bacterium]MCB9397013.1 FprA family A-type flavoprotein [Acidobacteriota bacterium]
MEILYNQGGHQNIWLEDFGHGLAVQANQHLIIHQGKAMILDPGGHKAYKQTITQVAGLLKMKDLQYIFLSHQDPDIVAALNGWLMTTEADAYCSKLWVRFIPHFGVDRLVEHRLRPIPDEGMILNLAGCDLLVLPAHFLHSVGNFHIYDPLSKILYSGDLGASVGLDYDFVTDFEQHLPYMQGFHIRYMTCNAALRAWVKMVRQLDIETIAPQHGAAFQGKPIVARFLEWCEELACGIDVLGDLFQVPQKT